jgi:glutamate-ammonia-ligase adenylyltransferase
MTNGDKPIMVSQFYGRLGQKIRHILDTKLLSGLLYEVDMRLRPSGDSGLLVTHIDIYEDYLKNQAWTWEHQALVRSRFITGDSRLNTAYRGIRQRILSLPRDYATIKTEVREMRKKMRTALASKDIGVFDLKHSKGGIADIEFIVQFLVLAQASEYPSLTVYTDNMRILESLGQTQLLATTTVNTLKNAYCYYRDLGHKLALQDSRALIAETEVAELKDLVAAIWDELME